MRSLQLPPHHCKVKGGLINPSRQAWTEVGDFFNALHEQAWYYTLCSM